MPFAVRSALPMSRLQTEPDRPYGVAFASRIASASESNGMIETTGPKISSFAIRMSLMTPSKTAGMRYAPLASAGSSGASPPTTRFAPSAEPDLDVVPDAVALLEADERPDLGLVVRRVADDDLPRRLGEQLDDLLVDRALDEDPRAGAAVLAAVVEDRVRRLGREALDVGVGVDDVRALAAELEADLLHVVRGQPHDLLAGRRLAGERDLADARVRGDRGAGGPARPGHDVEHAGRKARLEGQLAEPQRGIKSNPNNQIKYEIT